MELVKGLPITKYCDDRRVTPRERLRLFLLVCRAIQHAHQKGIIHRDIKPSNVLVAPYDGRPVPKVIDFGLAKATGQRLTERTLFTGFGTVLGTLGYMSPEQAELNNQDIDTRSDIYSLGVLLYELVTGTTPLGRKRLKEAALTEVLRIIRVEEPPKPSTRLSESKDSLPSISAQRQMEPAKLTKLVRGELDWIVMKTLDKDRNRRYETANGLAMDIERYLADEPVQACAPSFAYRFRKFARRNKGPLLAASLVALSLVAGVTISTWFAISESAARVEAEAQRQQTTEALNREQQTNSALRWMLYVSTVRLADQELDRGNTGTARSLLSQCPKHLRGWEWDRLQYACHFGEWEIGPFSQGEWADWSPDEKELVTCFGPSSKKVTVWDMATGKKKFVLADGEYGAVSRLLWSPKEPLVAAATEKGTIIWRVASGAELRRVEGGAPGSTYDVVAWSPDGHLLATVLDYTKLNVWNVQTGVNVFSYDKGSGGITGIAWSPSSKLVAISSHTGIIQVFDLNAAELLAVFSKGTERVTTAVCWSHDEQRLATAGYDKVIRVWELTEDGKAVVVKELAGHTAPVWTLAWSSDDGFLASSGDDRLLRVWDVAAGVERGAIRGSMSRAVHLRWSRDNKWLLACDGDRPRLIDADGADNATNLPTSYTSRTLSWRADNRHLAVNWREMCLIWDTPSKQVVFYARVHNADEYWKPGVQTVAFSHNGKFLATAGMDKLAKIWDAEMRTGVKDIRDLARPPAETPVELKCLRGHADTVHTIDWSPDDKKLATGSADGSVKIWDAVTGMEQFTLVKGDTPILTLSWSPDGRFVATGGDDKSVGIWNIQSRALMHALTGNNGPITSLAWSPDSQRLISAGGGGVKIWNVATGTLVRDLRNPDDSQAICAWSPDGRRVAIAGGDPCVRILDPIEGDELLSLRGHGGPIGALAWSPDGKRLASADRSGRLKIWDTENRKAPEWIPSIKPSSH